jgi:hypothetical protein
MSDARNVARADFAPGPSLAKKSVKWFDGCRIPPFTHMPSVSRNIAGARGVGLNRRVTKNEGCRVLGEGCCGLNKIAATPHPAPKHPTPYTLVIRSYATRMPAMRSLSASVKAVADE